MTPLAIDLFAGLGGWTDGLLAEGWNVIGFDIERHQYGDAKYPAQLVLQDVLTIHGRQFKDADLIVASPPCQEFSYMAMPWSRAKAKRAAILADPAERKRLTALFDSCFRIQREAIEAAGHFIPLVVENVRGANEWVGRSRWNFGSYHLWGDVPALMPMTKTVKLGGGASWYPLSDPRPVPGLDFTRLAGQKVPGFRFDGSGKSFQMASVAAEGFKTSGMNWNNRELRGQDFTRIAGKQASVEGMKTAQDGLGGYGGGFGWDCSPMRRGSSKGNTRKAASAAIAKIPFALSSYIAKVYYP